MDETRKKSKSYHINERRRMEYYAILMMNLQLQPKTSLSRTSQSLKQFNGTGEEFQ